MLQRVSAAELRKVGVSEVERHVLKHFCSARCDFDPADKVLGLEQVLKRLKVSALELAILLRRGELVRPANFGGRAVWRADDLPQRT